MTQVLIVGCGDLGAAVASQLQSLGISSTGVRRSAVAIEGVTIIQADVTQMASLQSLKIRQPEVLIYCVAANGQTDAQYQAHYVEGLRNVLSTQRNNSKLIHVFFVSSTRVYGQSGDAILSEADIAIPADFGGNRLLEAEDLLQTLHCKATVLRLSGIYGSARLRMINLAKSPQSWPHPNSWSNRIHRDDAAAFMVFLVQQVLAGHSIAASYIVTDSRPVPQHEVLRWIAEAMQLDIGNVAEQPVQGGKRLSNQAMLATGFMLRYPDFRAGYQAILSSL